MKNAALHFLIAYQFLICFIMNYDLFGLFRRRKNIIKADKHTEIKQKVVEGESLVLTIKLKNFKDEQTYGPVEVSHMSSGKKTYKVIFDTGSNFIWIRGDNSKLIDCNGGDDCSNKFSSFQNKLDSTINEEMLFFVKYNSGNIALKSNNGNITIKNEDKENNYFLLDGFSYGISVYEEKEIFQNVNSCVNL
jgi:hypothetical protein